MRSIELRWFCERELPDAVLRDFDDHGQLEVREDLYLWGTGEAIGVKLRGGQLETKQRERVGELTIDVAGVAIHGVVEHWQKMIEPPRAPNASERWVAVGKRRALRTVNHARAELTGLELRPSGGLTLRGPAHVCSVALEALPIAGSLELLRAELIELLADHHGLAELVEPGIGWSGGYPAWLARSLAPVG